MVPNDAVKILSLYRKIGFYVRLFTPPSIDREDIAQSIMVEAWQGQKPVTVQMIRHRCIDRIRSSTRFAQIVKDVLDDRPQVIDEDGPELLDTKERLDVIFSAAELTEFESMVIYVYFYETNSIALTAATLHTGEPRVRESFATALSKLQLAARITLRKENYK